MFLLLRLLLLLEPSNNPYLESGVDSNFSHWEEARNKFGNGISYPAWQICYLLGRHSQCASVESFCWPLSDNTLYIENPMWQGHPFHYESSDGPNYYCMMWKVWNKQCIGVMLSLSMRKQLGVAWSQTTIHLVSYKLHIVSLFESHAPIAHAASTWTHASTLSCTFHIRVQVVQQTSPLHAVLQWSEKRHQVLESSSSVLYWCYPLCLSKKYDKTRKNCKNWIAMFIIRSRLSSIYWL